MYQKKIMKKPHNMKPGEVKNFKNLGELNEFAENHIYDVKEFKLKSNTEGHIEITKR
jgi:hypothetical protein